MRFVNPMGGCELQYGNPLRMVQNEMQIVMIRDHFVRVRGKSVSSYLLAMACLGLVREFVFV